MENNVVIDWNYPQGTPCQLRCLEERHFLAIPNTSRSGSQWFHFCVRISNLPKGEKVTLEVQWPPVMKREDLPAKATEEQILRLTQLETFLSVLPQTVVVSEDLCNWHSVAEYAHRDGDRLVVQLPSYGKQFYFATQIPYTFDQYESLLNYADSYEPGCVQCIGNSGGGLPISAVVLPATDLSDAPVAYIQAYQHGGEYDGPRVIDEMIRYLLDNFHGQRARQRISWHFVPAVDIDRLFHGNTFILGLAGEKIGRPGNMNRDWHNAQWAEVQVVESFVRDRLALSDQYVIGWDLHNGWCDSRDSGANFTISLPDSTTAEYMPYQKEMANWIYVHTNYEKLDKFWEHDAHGRFCDWFGEVTGAVSSVVELSRYKWWNRHKQAYEPTRPYHAIDFAQEAILALDEYERNNVGTIFSQ